MAAQDGGIRGTVVHPDAVYPAGAIAEAVDVLAAHAKSYRGVHNGHPCGMIPQEIEELDQGVSSPHGGTCGDRQVSQVKSYPACSMLRYGGPESLHHEGAAPRTERCSYGSAFFLLISPYSAALGRGVRTCVAGSSE